MINKKYILLVALLALLSVSCGTDGLDVNQGSLSFETFGEDRDAIPEEFSEIEVGQSISFTIGIQNGSASDANLTVFTNGGEWLEVELIDNGTQVQLSGTPTERAFFGYSYSLTAVSEEAVNASTSFTFEFPDD